MWHHQLSGWRRRRWFRAAFRAERVSGKRLLADLCHCWKLIIPHFKYEIAGHPKWTEGVEFHEFVLAHVLHGIEEGPQSKLGDGTQEPGYMTLTVVYFVVIIVIQTAVIQGIVIDVSARGTPHRGTHDLPACSSVYTAKTL